MTVPPEVRLLELLAATVRGPRREATYAVWLVTRIALDLLGNDPGPERVHRRRVQLLEQRLTSLTMPPPVRRALAASVQTLREATPEAGARALHGLIAPTREALGGALADCLRDALGDGFDRVAAAQPQH